MANSIKPIKYLNIADIKRHWLEVIAPNYFDFDIINNYQVGVFGYINEVMGEVTEDGFNSVNAARREFYPVTAEYMSSLYKMATLQGVEIPVTTPASCKAALVLSQNEVITNSTFSNGIYTCVLDSCMKIFADNLQFMLDYPVVILSKKNSKGGWSHTIHYDVSVSNSLNITSTSRYIPYKVIKNSGMNYLVLLLDTIRQVEMTRVSNVIIKDSILDTVSMEIDYDGNLAGFEVFYIANQTSPRVQLKKVLINGKKPNGPFCYYERINNQKLRLTFPAVTSFTPEFNSEIETIIYTSSGEDGNFDQFDGELVCTSDSEDYPYNSTMTIVGQVNGSATGGVNQKIDEEFRTEILRAYSTNYTVTTSNDLQVYFDRISESITNMRVAFRKKRDDAFVRLWGAYLLMKDRNNNVIPANTLDLEFKKSDITDVKSPVNRISIKPGTKMIYQAPNDSTNFKGIIRLDSDTRSYTDKYGEAFTFTNPFLMIVNLQPNTIGYYLNSINDNKTIEYKYVNDDTATQFIANNLKIYRNAMSGSNYYKLSISLSPASDDFDPDVVAIENPYSTEEDPETGATIDINGIRASQNGVVESIQMVCKPLPGQDPEDETKYCYIEAVICYEDGSKLSIQASNVITDDESTKTGYKMNFESGDSFVKDDILATKLATDLGKLKLVGDINGSLYAANKYIPFQIESVNDDVFHFCAYLSTSDFIDSESNMEIVDGIFNMDGTPDTLVALPIEGIIMELHSFYKNDDINFTHKYSNYPYLSGYTLTNTYISSEDTPIVFIEPLKFIRSVLDFYEVIPTPDEFPIQVDNTHECETMEIWSAPRAESAITYEITFHGNEVPVEINDPFLRSLFEEYGIPIKDVADFRILTGEYEDDHIYHVWEWNNAYKDLEIPFRLSGHEFGIKSELVAPGDLNNGNSETEYWLRRTELTGAQLKEYQFLMGTENARIEISDAELEASDEENENAVQAIYLLYSYIKFANGGGEYIAPTYIDKADYGISVSECPLLSYDWAMIPENYTDFAKRLKQTHDKLQVAYSDLENNFSIDMKFYNTYGKSRFYTVGLDDASTPLNNITCSFSFGVRTSTLANKDDFIRKLRNFIKEYIENIDNIKAGATVDIYIHNLTSAIYEEYKEVGYIIYYGFNIYGTDAQKIIGPDVVTFQRNYIPEFINVKLVYDPDGNPYPDIKINLLEN